LEGCVICWYPTKETPKPLYTVNGTGGVCMILCPVSLVQLILHGLYKNIEAS